MPIRIYTTAPARNLLDDRPFGITAWTDDTHAAEVYAIVLLPDGTPVLRGHEVSLTSVDIEGGPRTSDAPSPWPVVGHAVRHRLPAA
jgi:hypothetical protein